jgi:uncharacterized protein YkwD
MKRLAWLLVLAGGCHDHDDPVLAPDPWYLRYGNGHPIGVAAPISAAEADMIDLINEHRVLSGRNALVVHPGMQDLARAHSIHMGLHGFVGELNPEGDDAEDRADIAGIFRFDYDEITGAGTSHPFLMFDLWLDAPAHVTIDDPFWTDMGVGYYNGHWTADFADR